MTTANCPACGAPITFRFSNSAQTVCQFCQSILVRHDLDLEKVGEVSSMPDDASPLQIGSEGVYRKKPFQIAGRILYSYDLGSWNEWHIVFADGVSGWLSDAQLEYAITFASPAPEPLPERGSTTPGQAFQWKGQFYQAATLTLAHYSGLEGELPFQYWDKSAIWFLDLRTENEQFATIDYSEEPPLLFLGETVGYDSLKLKNIREFEGWERG